MLGLGNVLVGDDGAGVAALSRLHARYEAPPGTELLDGGTLGLWLLPWLQSARAAILVDAVAADAPPGTLLRLTGDEVAPAVEARLSPHQVGVADLLHGLTFTGTAPERLVLLGVVPEALGLEVGLTAPVADALDGLVAAVVREAAALGRPFAPRAIPGEGLPALRRLGI